MGDCRGLKSIYRSDARKRQRGCDKNDRLDDKRPDEEDKTEEEHDKDPRHAYKDPDRSVRIIFGGKVDLENGRQRKLTVTPQVFSSIIALHCISLSMHHSCYFMWLQLM
jgi:hypothetical protein